MAYYGWVVKRMYFDEPATPGRLKEPTLLVGVLVACTIIIIVVGLYPGPILHYLFQVANHLLPATANLNS
jgi:NADH-quinone oxidoreductase subunit N